MSTITVVLIVSLAVNVILVGIVFRLIQKLLGYDEIFQYMVDDIETNLKQFARMEATPVLSNEPEVQKAHHNMVIMRKRLDEILRQMESMSGLKLRTPPPPPRPKVI